MTKTLWTLVRVQMLMSWRSFRGRMGAERSRWGLLLLPLVALGMIPLVLMITSMYSGLFLVLKGTGSEHAVLVMGLAGGQIVSLVFGVFYVISSFYFAKDLGFLIPLPIRPREILLSKFITIMLGEYLTIAIAVMPAVLVYGLFAPVTARYWLYALVIYLLIPVLPLALASLFTLVLMRVTNLRRNRDLFRVIGGLVGVAIALVIQMAGRFSQGGALQADPDAIGQFLESNQRLLDSIGRFVPTSLWGAEALKAGAPGFGILPFLLYVGSAVVAVLILGWVAEKIFYGGLVGGEEVRSSGRRLSRAELAQATGQVRTPLWALLQREVKLLNRTPTFLMAAIVPVVLMPVMMIVPIAQQGDLARMMTLLGSVKDSPLVPLIAMGALLFLASLSSLPATAISREGSQFWISRSLPVAPRVQVHAKLLHSMLMVLIYLVLVVGGLGFLGVLTPQTLIYTVLGGLAGGAATGYAALIIDLLHPHLTWTDPQQAMKGNLNVLFALLLSLLIATVVGIAAGLLYAFVPVLLLPGTVLLFGLIAYGLGKAAGALADNRYGQYEE